MTAILEAISEYPGLDVNKVYSQIAAETQADKIIRPDPKDIRIFFLNAIRMKAVRAKGDIA